MTVRGTMVRCDVYNSWCYCISPSWAKIPSLSEKKMAGSPYKLTQINDNVLLSHCQPKRKSITFYTNWQKSQNLKKWPVDRPSWRRELLSQLTKTLNQRQLSMNRRITKITHPNKSNVYASDCYTTKVLPGWSWVSLGAPSLLGKFLFRTTKVFITWYRKQRHANI